LPRDGSREHDHTSLPSLASCILGNLSQLCRDELPGVDVRVDGWDIRGRWFGVVVATPRLGALRRGETIPWRVIATLIAPRERRT
jgi:hypothetical protein